MAQILKDLGEIKKCRTTLQDQLFLQTAAMFKYCYNSGIKLKKELFDDFDEVFQVWVQKRDEVEKAIAKKEKNDNQLSTIDFKDIDFSKVSNIHNILSEKVFPARPASILLIESEMLPVPFIYKIITLKFLGPVRIVRAMMGVSLLMLILFIWLAISKETNLDNFAAGLYDLHGIPLLINLLFLLSSAGIGASFAALFELRTFISNRTYDTVYATDYWIRFILGLISGLILAELIPVDTWVEADSMFGDFARPGLAMLGGFSVQAVYRILQRFVQTLETMVQGKESSSDEAKRKDEAKEEAKKQVTNAKNEFLSDLIKLQKVINETTDPDEIKSKLDEVFDKLSSS
jgi:hypothetical protein